MSNVVSLMNDYIIRLSNMSSSLKLMGVLLAARDSQLRNGETALAAERVTGKEMRKLRETEL